MKQYLSSASSRGSRTQQWLSFGSRLLIKLLSHVGQDCNHLKGSIVRSSFLKFTVWSLVRFSSYWVDASLSPLSFGSLHRTVTVDSSVLVSEKVTESWATHECLYNYSQKWHPISFAIFYWLVTSHWYHSALMEGLHNGVNTRRHTEKEAHMNK